MRTVINSTYITIDGVIQNPQNWPSLGSLDDAGNRVQLELLDECDAILMGRNTYEVFAPVFPAMAGDPVSDRMNSMRKYVVSSTLEDPEWNNTTVIPSDPVGVVRALKAEPGANIVQYGFGAVSRALLAEGLLDELRLWVHPFMLGTGGPDDLLFRAGSYGDFTVLGSTTLSNGIVILTFAAGTSRIDGR